MPSLQAFGSIHNYEPDNMAHQFSLIVATKDRPKDLRVLLESLRRQTINLLEIVIVDASSEAVESVVGGFPDLTIRYLKHWPPSAAAQRNAGIRASSPAATLIAFADDDTSFEPDAFAKMLSFWEAAEPDVRGASFNIRNYPKRNYARLKRSALVEWLGLYSARSGGVAMSGWQTIIGEIANTQFADWIPTTAAVFRCEALKPDVFDEFFEGYSYLEDLDFSYAISRLGRLAIVADAGFSHFPSQEGRVSSRQFGRCEVRNRLYFVRKHRLSLTRCYVGLAIRLAMSVGSGVAQRKVDLFGRALGNIEELIRQSTAPTINIPMAPQR
jgi:GT2 family glycosyltransferase